MDKDHPIESLPDFRQAQRASEDALVTIAEELSTVEDHFEVAVDFLGKLSLAVVDEYDNIDGKPEWPSDAYGYYAEQLGATSTLKDIISDIRRRVLSLATNIHEYNHE